MPGSAAAPRPAGSGLADRRRAPRALGLAGLIGLLAAAVPLAAPGPGMVPGRRRRRRARLAARPLRSRARGLGPGAYYALLWAAFAAYLCVLFAAPALGRRLIAGAAVALILGFALSPPLLSQDVFSYIAYARLGALHGLNPYTHAPDRRRRRTRSSPMSAGPDRPAPTGRCSRSRPTRSRSLSVPAALWVLKAAAAASVLALAALVARLAPARGIDPRRGFAIVALNPLVLVHVVGGAHNDAAAMLVALAGLRGGPRPARGERRRGRHRRDLAQAERRVRRPVRPARRAAAQPVPGRRHARSARDRRGGSGRVRPPRARLGRAGRR